LATALVVLPAVTFIIAVFRQCIEKLGEFAADCFSCDRKAPKLFRIEKIFIFVSLSNDKPSFLSSRDAELTAERSTEKTTTSKDRGKTTRRDRDRTFIKKILSYGQIDPGITVRPIDFRYDGSVLKN